MPQVDETAILKRAKERCERDGFGWEAEYVPVNPGGPLPKPPLLNEADRREYLTRARDDLIKERADGE